MRKVLAVIGLALVLAMIVFGLVSCAAEDNAAAARASAEAQRITAQAQADETRIRAQAAADSERATIRQMERDASMERMAAMLPYVMVILVVFLGLLAGALISIDIMRRRPAQATPAQQSPPLLPPQVTVIMLPAGQSRREMWRQLSTQAGPQTRDVTVWDER